MQTITNTTSLDTALKPIAIDYLREFLRIDSRSGPQGGVEGGVQRVVAGHMRRLGAAVRTFQPREYPAFFTHPLCCGPTRDYSDRPTVIGTVGNTSDAAPTLLVMAHSDTVPLFDPDLWTVDPFAATVQGDRIVGLGASDDRWGMVAILIAIESLRSHPALKRKRLLFATTVDEENGVGNGMLLLHLAGVRADAALYLDGHLMEVDAGNLGGSNLYLRPKSAIPADVLDRHQRLLTDAVKAMSKRRSPLFDYGLFRENVMREQSVLLFRRGDAANPFFLIPFYTLPGESREAYCAELEAMVRKTLGDELAIYATSYREPWFEPSTVPENTPILRHTAAAVAQVTGKPARVSTMSKNDGFVLINHAKIPTVAFGPTARTAGRGAYHCPDECLTVDELWAGCGVAVEAVRRWLEE